MNRAFTLIELLVVISIIALLSSVVLASVASARDKARVASALRFDQSLYHALGDSAIGVYDFEEGSGSDVYDSSGYGNHGVHRNNSNVTANAIWTTGINGGTAINFTNSYVYIGNVTQHYLQGQDGSASMEGTITAWIKTANPGSAGYRAIVSKDYSYGMFLYGYVLSVYDWSIATRREDQNAIALNDDKWHHVAFSFSETGNSKLFVDGKRVHGGFTYTPLNNNGFLGIGGSTHNSQRWSGLIDNVRIYSRAIEE